MVKSPAERLQKALKTGQLKGVNPPISFSATFAFNDSSATTDCFESIKQIIIGMERA